VVCLCAAMRIDARRHPPRDRQRALDGDYLPLHVRAGLCREPSGVQSGACAWAVVKPGNTGDPRSGHGAASRTRVMRVFDVLWASPFCSPETKIAKTTPCKVAV